MIASLLVALMFVGQGAVDASPTQPKSPAAQSTSHSTNVLFLCPHGAAKSVLASAYFQRAAQERGLKVRVDAAGIDPQETVTPIVVEHLRQNHYVLPVTKPRAVTRQDIQTADVVVSMGCDLTGLPVGPEKLKRWDDVPGPSEDLAGADDVIRRRVSALVEELIGRQRK